MPPSYSHVTDLPELVSIFPLQGALLLPGTELPLNVFEPRYLQLVEDVLREDRLIGIIQPAEPNAINSAHGLANVGCIGRIAGFQETDDDRYLIVLKGVSRFRVTEETTFNTPYRTVRADWTPFAHDLKPHTELTDLDGTELANALREYLTRRGLSPDWPAIEESTTRTLINSISAECPFTYAEKQALLEARTLKDRCDALLALLAMGGRTGQDKEYVQ